MFGPLIGQWNEETKECTVTVDIASLIEDVIVAPGITVIIDGATLTNNRVITNFGTIVISNTGTLNNTGTIDIGTIDLSNTGTLTNNGNFYNTGTIVINSGDFFNSGDIIMGDIIFGPFGTIDYSNPGTIDIHASGNFFNSGNLTIPFGGTIDIHASGNLDNSGTLTTSGDIIIGDPTFLDFSFLTNDGTILVQFGGTIDNNNDLTNFFGNINNLGTIDNTNGNLDNSAGTITNTGTIDNTNGNLDNSGTLTTSGDIFNSGNLDNSGTLTIATGGTIDNSGTLTNHNTLTVQSGATLSGTGTVNGDVVLEDGATLSGTLTISGTVNPLADGQSVTTDEDTAVVITLTGSDGNSDPLTFLKVADPTKGTLGTITSVNSTSAMVTYTPNANANGADSFTFKANDGGLDSPAATVSITITAVNDAPTANAQSVTTNEDTALAITLTGTDVDGDALTFATASGPANGVLSGTAPNLTYTPNANFSGTDSFTFVVNDGTVDSASATVTITITAVNDLPVANAGADQTVQAGVLVTLDGSASSDAESAITYSWTQTAGPAVTLSDATAASPTFTSPSVSLDTLLTFQLIVNDGTANSAPDTVNVTVEAPANDDDSAGGGGGGGRRVVVINQQSSEPSVTILPESHFADRPLDRIQVSSLGFVAAGVSITQASVGQQISIASTFANFQEVEQDYAFIVQITNEDGFVVHLSWQQGTIESGAAADVSTSWTPTEDGIHTVQIFVWNDVGTSPAPLSTVTVNNIDVA